MPPETDTDLEADVRAAIEGPLDPPAAEQPTQQAEPTGDRTRDEHGRFAPKSVDSKAEVTQVDPAQGEEPARTILPPRTWTAAAKAKFATLDPDVQQEVLRREKEIDDGKAQWDSKAEHYNRLTKLYEPIRDRLTLNGLTEEAYTAALIRADEMLRSNPQAAMQQLAQLYGFQLPQGMQQPQQQQVDPVMQGLQQQVQQLTQLFTSQQQAREQGERQEIVGEIEAFRNDPKHIYFDNVRPKMVKLLEGGLAKDLPEAYDMACYADPEVRTLMAAKPLTPAKPGKPNGISVTGSPRGQGQASPNARVTAEDDVRAAMEELAGRV